MKKLRIPVLLFTMALAASCGRREINGSGASKTEGRNVSAFTKIEIESPVMANITVQPGAQPSLQLSGYANLLEHIETSIEGSTLRIRTKPAIELDTDKDVVATIIVSSLEDLDLSGSADANVNGIITGNKFELDISGAGNANIQEIIVSDLEVSLSGAGTAKIAKGTVTKANYEISGAGDISAYDVQGTEVKADVSGAGSMEVSATTKLDADVSGAGSIRYKGTPSVKSNTSGIGQISAAN